MTVRLVLSPQSMVEASKLAAKNKVYLVAEPNGGTRQFDNWPSCQDYVKGKNVAFVGGRNLAEAQEKLAARLGVKTQRSKAPVARPPASSATGRAPLRDYRKQTDGKQSAAKPANKFYLVEVDRQGVIREFNTWRDCKAFMGDKRYAYAAGPTYQEAVDKLKATREKQYAYIDGTAKPRGGKAVAESGPRPKTGITSDCGTHGNPGPCEYQVTDIHGKRLAYKHLGVHTNNYAELSGIEGMIHIALERDETELWTDSTIAMGWIKSGRIGDGVRERDQIIEIVKRIQALFKANPQLKLLKWNTKAWGQIPSDFGRK